MLWERVKNLTLLFFLLLNILLGSINLMELNRYNMTEEQIQAIYQVLKDNKISMYSKLIRSYAPMRTLGVSGFAYDLDALLPVFFTNPDAVTSVKDDTREVYQDYIARIELSNGYITYDCHYGWNNARGITYSPEGGITAATELCEAFIEQYFPTYRLDTNGIFSVEEGLRLCYREEYQDYIVYTNFIEFLITDNGIEQIDMQYGEIKRFDNRITHEICSPDEALLTFMQHVRVIYGDAPVIVKEMELVYSLEEISVQKDIILQAVPYYRIFVEQQELPFMINAYTNTLR